MNEKLGWESDIIIIYTSEKQTELRDDNLCKD